MYDKGRNFPLYYNSSSNNELQALNKRVLSRTIDPDIDVVKDFVSFAKKIVFRILPRKFIKRDTPEQYLLISNASKSVKETLSKEFDLMKYEGCDGRAYSRKAAKFYSRRKAFVKVENQLLQSDLGRSNKAPRLIQGAAARFICEVGPFFTSFQRYMKRVLSKDSSYFFTSGANNQDFGYFYDRFSNWNVLENDVSAWDSSLCTEICELEVWLAQRFGAPQSVVSLMQANVLTHGATTKGHRYFVPGTRKSGDPYTSCFNSLINILLHIYVYCKQRGKSYNQIKNDLAMMAMGDDNLLFHRGNRVVWKPLFEQLGFETVSKYEHANFTSEFCSAVPVPGPLGTVFVPKIGRVLSKFGVFIDPPPHVPLEDILSGVCKSYKLYKGFRVFEALSKLLVGKEFVQNKHVEKHDYGGLFDIDTEIYYLLRYKVGFDEYHTLIEDILHSRFNSPTMDFFMQYDSDARSIYRN